MVKVCTLADLFHLLFTLLTEIISNHLFLCEFSKTVLKSSMAFHLHRKTIVTLIFLYPIPALLTLNKIQFLNLQNRCEFFKLVLFFQWLFWVLYEPIEKLMRIFLHSCIDRHSLKILERKAKIIGYNIFLLTVFQIVIESLKLIHEIINHNLSFMLY